MTQEFPKGEIKSIKGRSFVIKGDDIDTDSQNGTYLIDMVIYGFTLGVIFLHP